MDLDAFVADRYPAWERLDELSRRRDLTSAETDELVDLYERGSTHLSLVRSTSPDPGLVSYLSAVLTRARLTASARRTTSWGDVARFFTHTFPGALYRTRRWWIATTVLNVAAAVAVGWWAVGHPEFFAEQMTQEEIEAYVGTDFENYYSEFPHHEFAALVWTNNAWVSAQAIAFGVLGLPTLWVLFQNTVNVGLAGALMVSHGRGSLFFGLILPHGLLELTAVFVAGATGLRLFWSWIEPGDRTRAQSFAAEARSAFAVALGLVPVLLVSGLIEGFVTPSSLPTWARIVVGVVAETAFLAYVVVLGRRAARDGATGDLDEVDRGASVPTLG